MISIDEILRNLDLDDIDQMIIDQFYKLQIYTELTFYLVCMLLLVVVGLFLWFSYRFKKLERLLKTCLKEKKEN